MASLTVLVQEAPLQFESAPGTTRPESLPYRCFHVQQSPIARLWPQGEGTRGTILDDLPPIDDQHPGERLRLADIVGDTEQGGMPPHTADTGQQQPALLAVEPAERLVKDHQPRPGTEHGAPKPYPLPLTTGHEATSLAERRLQTIRQFLEHAAEVSLFDNPAGFEREESVGAP